MSTEAYDDTPSIFQLMLARFKETRPDRDDVVLDAFADFCDQQMIEDPISYISQDRGFFEPYLTSGDRCRIGVPALSGGVPSQPWAAVGPKSGPGVSSPQPPSQPWAPMARKP